MKLLTRTKFFIKILVLAISLVGAGTSSGVQQIESRMTSPRYESEAVRLRAKAPRLYEFSKALLADVLRFLATDCEISFFSLPDGSPEGEKLVTFSLNASPFQALETLCKAYGLALVIDGGVWYIRPADDKELIGRQYEIKHNPYEKVSKGSTTGGTGSGNGESSGGSSSGTGATNTSSGTGGGASGSGQNGGIDLQGPRETFRTEKSELVNDIRTILDLPPETGAAGSGSSVSTFSGPATSGADSSGSPTDVYGNARKPKIIWKSDSNMLYVVATRLQHMWVEGYLEAADTPQSLIAIEAKFIETSRDPSTEFGIDWTGTLAEGYNANLTGLKTPAFDMNKMATTFMAPTSAVLSASDVNVKLRALLTDSSTNTVSYPSMVTTNNREVILRSVINQPVLGGSSSSSVTGGSTTTSAISYLPIGTVINILPKKMAQDKISLNISVTISSILGTTTIQGNPYPIATSRVYSAPVEVSNGYTVAIGGLDEAKEQVTDKGIPLISKIPLFGWLTKTRNKQKNHKNLMLFITPTLIDSKGGGLPDTPSAVLRRKPDNMMPVMPRLSVDGGLEGGVAKVPNAVAYMRHATQEIGQIILENRAGREEHAKISDLKSAIKRVCVVVDKYGAEYPDQAEQLMRSRWELKKLLDDLERQRIALVKKGYY